MLSSLLRTSLSLRHAAVKPQIVSALLPRPSLTLLSSQILSAHPILQTREYRYRQSLRRNRDYRPDYFVKRDRPLGPHRMLAPNVKFRNRIGPVRNYRHVVHYPKNKRYTWQPLPMTKLGGRDPVTGRKIIEGVGGGRPRRFRWIDWRRLPEGWDPEGQDYVERILEIAYDPNREPCIALTGHGPHVRWQIATENMKAGDLIRTSGNIPPLPVKPVEGDSYPVGALPVGTKICLIQKLPNTDEMMTYHARGFATIQSKQDKRVIIKADNNLEYSLDQRCQCVVGVVSIHRLKAAPIGSPNRKRWLGMRPRSGLFQRKSGIHGRKVKAPPPLQVLEPAMPERHTKLLIHCYSEGRRGAARGKKRALGSKWI